VIKSQTHSMRAPSTLVEIRSDRPKARPLIVRFGAMGDMILLTGLMQALHKRYGMVCDVLSSGGWTRPLLQGNPDLGELFLIKSRKRPYAISPEQWRTVAWLQHRPRGPVYVCDAYSQDKLRWLLTRAGVDPADCLYFQDALFPAGSHWFDTWKIFSELSPENYPGYPNSETNYPAVPNLVVDAAAHADAQTFLSANRFTGPLVLLQPGNKRTLKRGRLGAIGDDKSWPTANWIELCHALLAARPEARILLCGAPPEQPLLHDIATGSGSDRVHALGDQLPIARLLALMTRAHSLISIDSGPAHAAAALRCPTVVLFGENHPGNWLPRSPVGTPVIGLEAPADRPRRVEEISVERVFHAWSSLKAPAHTTSVLPDGNRASNR
jgi:heptosyltransferase-2/heptosyltransferase-3